MKKLGIFILFGLLISSSVFAAQSPLVKVQEIRKGGDQYVWLVVPDNGCGQGQPYIYWDASHADTDYRVSLSLTSLVSGKKIVAVGTCTSGYLTDITDFRISVSQ